MLSTPDGSRGPQANLFTDGLVDVTYMCDWCGTETKRAVREPACAGHARNGERRGLVA
jgi:hypothetical protein